MRTKYTDRNVDLTLLCKGIDDFFRRGGFRTYVEQDEDGVKIRVLPTHIHDIVGKITVQVSGTPMDFEVKFFSGTRSEALTKFGRLTSLFGGGVLFLRGVKSQEAEEKLERRFWVFVEEQLNRLQKPRTE
ncbi:MAG: hypothetical protein JSV35_01355 [Candidatus Bathyarchaeota archaeon]|nr:MAG: hypothetical protein JSV35_01355 [Candidatus Bathyarchaeota archaeon]